MGVDEKGSFVCVFLQCCFVEHRKTVGACVLWVQDAAVMEALAEEETGFFLSHSLASDGLPPPPPPPLIAATAASTAASLAFMASFWARRSAFSARKRASSQPVERGRPAGGGASASLATGAAVATTTVAEPALRLAMMWSLVPKNSRPDTRASSPAAGADGGRPPRAGDATAPAPSASPPSWPGKGRSTKGVPSAPGRKGVASGVRRGASLPGGGRKKGFGWRGWLCACAARLSPLPPQLPLCSPCDRIK